MNDFGDISMQQIELFLCVAECGSLAIAARKMYISQSNATRQIQKLESYLNTTLFIRTNRGTELTASGAVLYRKIKKLHSWMNAAFYDAKTAQPDAKGLVRIASVENNEIFDEVTVYVRQFDKLYPGSVVDLHIDSFRALREGVLSGRFDCAFTYSVSAKGLSGIETRYLKQFNTFFAVSSNSKTITGEHLEHKKLRGCNIIMNPDARYDLSATRELGICKLHGFEPKGIVYLTNEAAVASLVAADEGFCVCGPGFGLQYRDSIRLFPTEKPLKEEQHMVLLWNPDACPAQARRFVESISYLRSERS